MRAEDGIQYSCRIWRGEVGAPVILYLHGIEGHSQWFDNAADYLNQKGMTIYAPDRTITPAECPGSRSHELISEVM
ncbi:MAG: hypothetical protein R3C24_09975 [Cyanobacteriota/Melainabacteria group bacterium]